MGENPTMPRTRVALVVALGVPLACYLPAWAQGPAPEATPAPGTQAPAAPAATPAAADSTQLANNVLVEAIVKLRLRPRIAAKVEQDVDMLNQRFRTTGNYYKDTGNRFRLQLEYVGIGGASSTTLQVCDGKVRWEYQKLLGINSYRRLDIEPAIKKLEEPGLEDDFRTQVLTQIGLSGPEALITGFVGAVGFDQFAEQAIDGVPTYILGGKWKDRSKLMGPNDRPLAPTAPLPPYIPANVQLYVDKATLWPYRVEMRGNAPSLLQEEPTGQIDPITKRPIGVKRAQPKVDPTAITLRYTLLPESEIKPDEQFVFAAPRDASNVLDETPEFLRYLDQVIQGLLAQKKAKEAAGEASGEPAIKLQGTLPPIDVATPPPAIGTTPPGSPAPPR